MVNLVSMGARVDVQDKKDHSKNNVFVVHVVKSVSEGAKAAVQCMRRGSGMGFVGNAL